MWLDQFSLTCVDSLGEHTLSFPRLFILIYITIIQEVLPLFSWFFKTLAYCYSLLRASLLLVIWSSNWVMPSFFFFINYRNTILALWSSKSDNGFSFQSNTKRSKPSWHIMLQYSWLDSKVVFCFYQNLCFCR